MSSSNRCIAWLVILFVANICCTPINDEKIYFPGENPDAKSRKWDHGRSPIKVQPDYLKAPQNFNEWPHHRPLQPENVDDSQFKTVHSYSSTNDVPSALDGRSEGELQYQTPELGSSLYNSYMGPGESQRVPNYGGGSASQQSWDQTGGILQQGEMKIGLHDDSMLRHSQKMRKQTLMSHSSTLKAGHIGQGTQQITQPQETIHHGSIGLTSNHLTHSISTSAHKSHEVDLSSIINRPSSQHNPMHSNTKNAFFHAIQDFGDNSEQPSQQTVHKISHIKNTMVESVDSDPSQIHSSTTNDDIGLSHLIEQLQMLEQSARHINITWCEEKIKEFLQSLRRKQASGVIINQKEQEQTLHQILTQDAVQNTKQLEEIHEPLVKKVTVQPLGVENFSHSHKLIKSLMHEQESHLRRIPGSEHTDYSSEDSFTRNIQPEILTVVPQHLSNSPKIMSHQHETQNQVTPFTSDNVSNDLKELELELPEYEPFEHAHSGKVTEMESNTDTKELPPSSNLGKVPFEAFNDFPVKGPEATVKTPGYLEPTGENTLSIQEGERNQEDPSADRNNQDTRKNIKESDQSSTEKKDAIHEILLNEKVNSGDVRTNEFVENYRTSPKDSNGSPQAQLEQGRNAAKSGHEETLASLSEDRQLEIEKGKLVKNLSTGEHSLGSITTSLTTAQTLHKQQINYDTLIEELIQLESIPGHQVIDKCEEKIQEFLEILKYQQQQGFGRNQLELERLHQTLIEQAKERSKQIASSGTENGNSQPDSFWRKVQKKIKNTYENARNRANEVLG